MRQRFINRKPQRRFGIALAALPFILVLVAYVLGSDARLAENPRDKLLPSLTTIGDAVERMAFTENRRTGEYLLWVDTGASLARFFGGLLIATLIGGILGIVVGMLPYLRSTFAPFFGVLSMIPPLAILPILFIVFGLGETSKVALIVLGIAPFIIRDLMIRVQEIPDELMVKAQTLGASTWQIAWRVVIPQMMPRLIDAVRLSLGAAWLFLIAAEAIASQSGLGYRIFLMRRHLSMDVILPYVMWITLLAFLIDWMMLKFQTRAFPWFAAERGSQ